MAYFCFLLGFEWCTNRLRFLIVVEKTLNIPLRWWIRSFTCLTLAFQHGYCYNDSLLTSTFSSNRLHKVHLIEKNQQFFFLQIQITGNKMTSLNLATIFGPNLLHKQKSSDKEFSVQSSARAEESTAVIAVLQRMIASYQTLFMVSHSACVFLLFHPFHPTTKHTLSHIHSCTISLSHSCVGLK